jgi:hypothetical protein
MMVSNSKAIHAQKLTMVILADLVFM